MSESSIVAYYIKDTASYGIAVTEALGGPHDGRAMVMIRSPVDSMPLLIDPNTARDMAKRLRAAATATIKKRKAVPQSDD